MYMESVYCNLMSEIKYLFIKVLIFTFSVELHFSYASYELIRKKDNNNFIFSTFLFYIYNCIILHVILNTGLLDQ